MRRTDSTLFDTSRHKTLRGFISLFAALCLVFSLAALPAQAFADTDEGANAGSSAVEQTTESGVGTATDGTAADEGESEADLPDAQSDEASEVTESDDATIADPVPAEEAVSTQSDATVGVEPASVEVEPAALPEHEPLVTDVVSYDVSTDHYGEWVTQTDGSAIDLQVVKAALNFDKPVNMLNKDLLGPELTVKINGMVATYYSDVASAEADTYASPGPFRYVIDSLSPDGKTLNLRVYIGYAIYSGHLYVQSPTTGLTQLVYADDPTTSPATNIHCIVPNGMTTETVSATPATEDTPASTVTKFLAPEEEGNHITRAMVHIMVLKNGMPINDTLNVNWATAESHWHDYQNLTIEQYLKMCVTEDGTGGWLGAALSNDYILSVSGDELTITAKDSEPGDVLEVQISSYLNNGSLAPLKDALNQAIAAGQAILAGGAPAGKDAEFANLQSAMTLGQTSVNSPYFSQVAIDAKAALINAAIEALNPTTPPVVLPTDPTDPSAGQSTVGSSTTSTAKTSSVAAAATKSTMAATSDSFAISPALLLALALGSMLVLGASLYTRRSRKDAGVTCRR